MKAITPDSLKFFENYLNISSPTSYEYRGQKIWLDYIKPFIDEYHTDNYGTVYGVINPKAEYKVVLEAHADEISWMVHYITEDGFIYLLQNGGSDPLIAPSKRVNIFTKNGIVKGVFGWPAIHLRKGSDISPSVSNIFLDIGCTSKEEVEKLGVHIGCIATFEDEFMILNKKNICARAIDNRGGGFMIAQVARLLKESKKKLPFGLYIVNSVQEEVGLRGAHMIAQKIKPNVAIVTDVGHDTNTPMIDRKEKGDYKSGKGPILAYGPPIHNKLLDLIIETATKNKIPFQREANSRATGTDADVFGLAGGGAVTALISLPLKYMHTTVEMVSMEDVENVTMLMYHTLLQIKNNHDFKYL